MFQILSSNDVKEGIQLNITKLKMPQMAEFPEPGPCTIEVETFQLEAMEVWELRISLGHEAESREG
jgi:hypothetical protein